MLDQSVLIVERRSVNDGISPKTARLGNSEATELNELMVMGNLGDACRLRISAQQFRTRPIQPPWQMVPGRTHPQYLSAAHARSIGARSSRLPWLQPERQSAASLFRSWIGFPAMLRLFQG
jgi:hypothetical protein